MSEQVTFVEHIDEDGTPHQAVYVNGERVTRDVCLLDADDMLLVLNRLGQMYDFSLTVQYTRAGDVVEV